MGNEVQAFYGNRLRVRVCGICVKSDALLLVNHRGISTENFWAPPGGGIDFGESAAGCLAREISEETGLSVEIGNFLFACELIRPPLHAVELFFEVVATGGKIKSGIDPEPGSPSIIQEVAFVPWNEIMALPNHQRHGIFKFLEHPSKITSLRGYFKV
jgi:8-oxo-dGTP diphosphatase